MGNIFKAFGSYIPNNVKTNKEFESNAFYTENGDLIALDGEIIVQKFQKITGIKERRYLSANMATSDMGLIAAQRAIEKANIDAESIDHIIVAHNFGNVASGSIQGDMVPSLAARIKQGLGIQNPQAVAYDIVFGCPGWIQGVIQADSFIKTGMASNVLIIGCEALSRVSDPFDRDGMIFSDGAGACILSASDENKAGILSYSAVTHAIEAADYLYCGVSNNPDANDTKYIKMKGRKIYEYALNYVPAAMKDALDKSGYTIHDLKKVFIHQANEKMDDAIIERFYEFYDDVEMPANIMPMSIHKLGNSSVATVPTLMDMVLNGEMPEHKVEKGDVVILASVGAGMHINAIAYKF